ncbi:MAG: Flp pilus assembly protein CpaB [Bacteriovoracaceae bacterium]|nr:Flp pilus assembly protein CpaB [Bacteriovoracaceae bacterium]
MNTRAFTLALVIAIAAMFMVHTYIEDQKSSLIRDYGVPSTVVIAKMDIKELELIDDSKITTKTVPQNFLSPGHFKNMKALQNTVATVPILKGEQITKPRVTYPGAKTGLSRQVSVGKRAMSININAEHGVSKLIKPGDRVDLLAAIDYTAGRKDKQETKTVLQDVLVLSTGYNMTNSIPIYGMKTPKVIRKMNASIYTQYNTVTLELSPFDVQKIVYLKTFANARPYLSLRNNSDKEQVDLGATKIFDLLGNNVERQEAKRFFADKYKRKK